MMDLTSEERGRIDCWTIASQGKYILGGRL